MKINYIENLHIPSLFDWSPEAAGDWLHPSHGALPDRLGLLECDEREFMAALWELPNILVVMLEQLENDDPDPRVPMRHLDDVYTMRGWIIQTFRWEIATTGIVYKHHTIIPDEYRKGPEWRDKIYRTVLLESVRICTAFPAEK